MTEVMDPAKLLRPRRKIMGVSAILLPYKLGGEVDWQGFDMHLQRTLDAGLVPAVNMDTGYGNLIDDAVREEGYCVLNASLVIGCLLQMFSLAIIPEPVSPEIHIAPESSKFNEMVAPPFFSSRTG